MSSLIECSTLVPAWLCRHGDLLMYLAPSLLLALLIRALSARHPFFFLFTLAGTVCHELVSASKRQMATSSSWQFDGQDGPQFSIPGERSECSR